MHPDVSYCVMMSQSVSGFTRIGCERRHLDSFLDIWMYPDESICIQIHRMSQTPSGQVQYLIFSVLEFEKALDLF